MNLVLVLLVLLRSMEISADCKFISPCLICFFGRVLLLKSMICYSIMLFVARLRLSIVIFYNMLGIDLSEFSFLIPLTYLTN